MADKPIKIYTAFASHSMFPNNKLTKSILAKPNRPQLIPPIITKIIAIMSKVFFAIV